MREFACSALYNLQLPECKVDAAGRVFRVRGSSFLEKTCLGSPKKRVVPKKRLFNTINKKGARAMLRARQALAIGSVAAVGRREQH